MNRLSYRGGERPSAFTLIEIVLVVGIMVTVAAIAVPSFLEQIKREQLPGSAKRLRSFLTLVRANAAFDGKRYRIRFPGEDEKDPLGGDRQPLIEREDDPLHEPEVFNLVTAPWAVGITLQPDVWCAEVRLGRPTIERLQERRSRIEDQLIEELEDFDPQRPPLFLEPDGTGDWATFLLTQAPRHTELERLEEYPRIEVIYDGDTGLAWLQRPFYQEELDLFEEKGWPAVLRQDYLHETVITEDRVLELREFRVRP